MNRPPNPLIAQLVEELEPVRPLRMVHGFALLAMAIALTIAAVAYWQGLWAGPMRGDAASIFFIANGLVAMTGLASAWAVVRMASPRVGARQDGSRWMLAALAILPVTAGIIVMIEGSVTSHDHVAEGLHCFLAGTACGLAVGGVLVMWLRRGGACRAPFGRLLHRSRCRSIGELRLRPVLPF